MFPANKNLEIICNSTLVSVKMYIRAEDVVKLPILDPAVLEDDTEQAWVCTGICA